MKNPCLTCERLHENKNNSVCMECERRVAYAEGIETMEHTIPSTLKMEQEKRVLRNQKKCPACGELLWLDSFEGDGRTWDRLSKICRSCKQKAVGKKQAQKGTGGNGMKESVKIDQSIKNKVKTGDKTDTVSVNLPLPRQLYERMERVAASELRTFENQLIFAVMRYADQFSARLFE